LVDRLAGGADAAETVAILEDLCHTLKYGSLCALGGFTPYPVMSAVRYFPEDFGMARQPAGAEQ
jgi:formate dehydrogenase iron-sulfur subunit